MIETLTFKQIHASLLEPGGIAMPMRTPPKIIAAKQQLGSRTSTIHCPACVKLLHGPLCADCNLLVHASQGFNVATRDYCSPATLREIRDFLHPPEPDRSKRTKGFKPKDLPLGTASERMIRDHEAMIEDIAHGRPIVVGDDTAITRVADGVVFAAPLPASKPSGKLAKYEPRRLAHERKASPWLWRTVYAVITMTAAALTLWQALRVG